MIRLVLILAICSIIAIISNSIIVVLTIKKTLNTKKDNNANLGLNFLDRNELTGIPSDKYDPDRNGVLCSIPYGFYTAHRIYFDPITNRFALQYGQFIYKSLWEAQLGVRQTGENIFIKAEILNRFILKKILIIKKGASDLNNGDDVKIIHIDRDGMEEKLSEKLL